MTSDQLALVIEDDVEIARFFALVLKDVGFEVESLHNGRAAVTRLAEIVPRLVILDMNMPAVSGVEILNRIRSEARLEEIPVIVVTANPQMADHVYDLADLVLNKPISYDQLRDLARRFV
jgi:DNA-binding response OmpR family regulator